MSIQRGLSRNRDIYRRFLKEEDSIPTLPEREPPLFEEVTLPESTPEATVYRMASSPVSPALSAQMEQVDSTDLDAAADALLRRLDDEARLFAQTLEEE